MWLRSVHSQRLRIPCEAGLIGCRIGGTVASLVRRARTGGSLSSSVSRRSAARVALVSVLFLSVGLCAHADEAMLTTLVHGLEYRSVGVPYLRGRALQQTFCSKACADDRAAWLSGDEDAPGETAGARTLGEYLVRFQLGQDKWRYEVQPLLTPGGAADWGFAARPKSGEDDGPLYHKQVACLDGTSYTVLRSADIPKATIERQQWDLPGPMQPPLGTWTGLAMNWLRWPQHMIGSHARLLSVSEAQLDGRACFLIAQAIERERVIGNRLLWVSSELAFAPLRKESFVVQKANPRSGTRVVDTWDDYEEVGPGIHIPTRYAYDEFRYRPDVPEVWWRSERVAFRDLRLDAPTEDEAQTMALVPLGALLLVPLQGRVPSGGPADPLSYSKRLGASAAPWLHAEAWADAYQSPPEDPEFRRRNADYLQPLAGEEVRTLWEQYAE